MNAPLVLTDADQRNVQVVIRELLTSGDHESLDDWRLAVHVGIRRLVDCDMAFSYVGAHPFASVLSREIGRINEFPTRAAPLIAKFNTFERTEKLAAWSRASLWGSHLGEFMRSSYYHDFSKPLGSYDGVGIAIRTGGVHAGIQLHRGPSRGPRMGVRDVQLLRLVLPAFQIGIEMARSVFAARNQSAPLHQRESRVIEASSAQENGRHVPTLTPREREVIALLAARRSNTEIAELLQVSRATAKRHTENILQKLGLHSRLEVERVISDL